MSCIAPDRFVELLEAGPDSAHPGEAEHLGSCAECRDSWARLAGADQLLRAAAPVVARGNRLPLSSMIAAAAALLLAVGLALWKSPGGDERSPVAPQDGGSYSPEPRVSVEVRPNAEAAAANLIHVDAVIIRAARGFAGQAVADPPSLRRISRADLESLTAAAGPDPDAELVQSPRLVLEDGAEGSIVVGDMHVSSDLAAIDILFDGEGPGRVNRVTAGGGSATWLTFRARRIAGEDAVRFAEATIEFRDSFPGPGPVDTPYGPMVSRASRATTARFSTTVKAEEALLIGPLFQPSNEDRRGYWILISAPAK